MTCDTVEIFVSSKVYLLLLVLCFNLIYWRTYQRLSVYVDWLGVVDDLDHGFVRIGIHV